MMGIGIIISNIKIDIKRESYQVIVIETKDNYFIAFDGLERYMITQYDNEYEVGDILKVTATKERVEDNSLESEFNFKDYLEKKGITYSLKTTNIIPIFRNTIKLHKIRKNFLIKFNEDSRAIIGAILFSDNSYQSIVKDNVSSLHLIRLISTSGLYIYLFLWIIRNVILYRLKDKKARLISIILLSPYLIFTYPRFCVIKIVFVYLFRYLNDYVFKTRITYLSLISITGIIFLLFDYHLAYQDSFILGFMIPIVIYFINHRYKHLKKYFVKLVVIPLLFLSFIPYEMKYFNEIALLNPIYQIILSPFFLLLGILGMISFIQIPIYELINQYVYFINHIVLFFKLFNPLIYAPPFNEYTFFLYYLLLSLFAYFLDFGLLIFQRMSLIFFSMIVIVQLSPLDHYIKEEVYFINVGQGDCTLIRKGETSILIDVGGNIKKDIAKEVLIPFFKKKQIYDIDLIISTHDDYDHVGALDSLLDHFIVHSYYKDQDLFPIKIENIELNNYNYHYSIDDNNLSSLVISFHFASLDFLIMGDAPISIEKEIMRNYEFIPCDVLKVGHHGSNTSTCEEFIQYLSPKEAIISCGKNNKYGHPHQSIINILKRNNVLIKRTDLLGTIQYISYG